MKSASLSFDPRTIVLAIALSLLAACAQTPTVPADPRARDAQLLAMLLAGSELLQNHHPEEAIATKFDPVIADFEARFANEKRTIYCARTVAETAYYLTMSLGTGKNAIALNSLWADAYYLKGYALVELKRLAEADRVLNKAVALSPKNAHYLSELGEVYGLEKHWQEALIVYREAESAAPTFSPPEVKVAELARAKRGVGFVNIELGNLDVAEDIFRQRLAEDPADAHAANELKYIQGLRAKQQQQSLHKLGLD